jgi:uncharacterized protein RhaS with RHS repeats
MEGYERTASIVSAGVMTTTCMHRKAHGTRETPAVVLEVQDQPASRESQAGLFGAAERLIVPMKPGNSGGGKEPYFWHASDLASGSGIGGSLVTPAFWPSSLLKELYLRAKGIPDSPIVKPIGKPDALNAPVRFEVAGTGNQLMDRLVRHSQRKRRVTDRSNLRAWRQFSTLL